MDRKSFDRAEMESEGIEKVERRSSSSRQVKK